MTEPDEKIDLLGRAIDEINTLRHINEILEAKVSTFEMCARFLHAEPPRDNRGYSEDIVFQMQRCIDNSKTKPEKPIAA